MIFFFFFFVSEHRIVPLTETQGFELSPEARAQADLKFTYVVTCQIYGKQREERKPQAADIALLMQRYVCIVEMAPIVP